MTRKLPDYPTRQEFEQLLVAASKVKHKKKKQFMVAILLGFESGLRISEIVGLHDYKTNKWIIEPLRKENIHNIQIKIISGKGKKDRIVLRPKRLKDSYLKLFPLTLNRRTLQRFITQLSKQALNKHFTFHSLRHGFGSYLATKRPLHELQMLMGHAKLDTTSIYLHANPKDAVEGALKSFD